MTTHYHFNLQSGMLTSAYRFNTLAEAVLFQTTCGDWPPRGQHLRHLRWGQPLAIRSRRLLCELLSHLPVHCCQDLFCD